jgi:hypothetical protein
MKALESHFSKTFGDTDPKVQVDDIWWDGLQSIDDATKTKLDIPITLNELTTVLFKEMAPNKSPGSDGINVLFLRKFWKTLSTPFMESVNEAMDLAKILLSDPLLMLMI